MSQVGKLTQGQAAAPAFGGAPNQTGQKPQRPGMFVGQNPGQPGNIPGQPAAPTGSAAVPPGSVPAGAAPGVYLGFAELPWLRGGELPNQGATYASDLGKWLQSLSSGGGSTMGAGARPQAAVGQGQAAYYGGPFAPDIPGGLPSPGDIGTVPPPPPSPPPTPPPAPPPGVTYTPQGLPGGDISQYPGWTMTPVGPIEQQFAQAAVRGPWQMGNAVERAYAQGQVPEAIMRQFQQQQANLQAQMAERFGGARFGSDLSGAYGFAANQGLNNLMADAAQRAQQAQQQQWGQYMNLMQPLYQSESERIGNALKLALADVANQQQLPPELAGLLGANVGGGTSIIRGSQGKYV